MLNKYFSTSFILICFLLVNESFSQTSINVVSPTAKSFIKSGDIFGTRNFIENKGQFINPIDKNEELLFKYEHGGEKIYFTKKGLVYEQTKRENLSEEERERIEPHESKQNDEQHFYVKMNWLNSNTNVEVQKNEKQNHYFTFGTKELNSYAYKKIVYSNVYNNIDIEYVIPQDKEIGIKYNVILHPGADYSQLKIFYSGDINSISKEKNGDVTIKTKFENIIEHAPKTFDENGNSLACEFILNRNILSFNFPNGINQNSNITVDPWVTTITTLTTSNSAFDVDYDFNGNTFVYGGSTNYQIAMYNSSGVLQWTFAGMLTTPSWQTTSFPGNFAIDKFTGKSFTGQGFNPSGSQVIRLDISGNYDNFISTVDVTFKEIWDLGFFCQTGQVFIFGGTTATNVSAATINTVNSSLNLTTFQPTNTGCCIDVVSYAIDDQGSVFVLFASASNTATTNRICAVNSTFSGNNWTQPTGFTVMSENANKGAYQPAVTSNGFNALAVNNNYVYYYNGLNLGAYSKLTGASLATIALPGMTLKRQGGIAVDGCDNIYIGGNGSIITYSFNGTSFSTLTPISLGISTATQNVQDIKLDRVNNILYVCGTGFVGTYTTPYGLNCSIGTLSVGISGAATVCPGQGIILTASGANSYTWDSGATTPTVMVFPTVSTTYTVTGLNTNACGNSSGTAVSMVTVMPSPTISITGSINICKGDKRTLTANGAGSYTWVNGPTTASISITPTVSTSYTVIGTSTAFPCSARTVVNVSVNVCKGIPGFTEEKVAKIYPNPVKEKLVIELMDYSSKNFEIQISNSIGQVIFNAEKINFSKEKTIEINTESFPKGIYFVVLKSEGVNQSVRLVKD